MMAFMQNYEKNFVILHVVGKLSKEPKFSAILRNNNFNDIMEYNHREIEKRWQEFWRKNRIYEVKEEPSRKKFYVLDM